MRPTPREPKPGKDDVRRAAAVSAEVKRALTRKLGSPKKGSSEHSSTVSRAELARELLNAADKREVGEKTYHESFALLRQDLKTAERDSKRTRLSEKLLDVRASFFAMLGVGTCEQNDKIFDDFFSRIRTLDINLSRHDPNAPADTPVCETVTKEQVMHRTVTNSAAGLADTINLFRDVRKTNWARISRDRFPLDTDIATNSDGLNDLFDPLLDSKNKHVLITKSLARLLKSATTAQAARARCAFGQALLAVSYIEMGHENEAALRDARHAGKNRQVLAIAGRHAECRVLSRTEAFDLHVCHALSVRTRQECWVPRPSWYRLQFQQAHLTPYAGKATISSIEMLCLGAFVT